MGFHVGQQVVCVDAAHTNSQDFPELIERAIYTIRWVGVDDGIYSVRLVESTYRDLWNSAQPYTARRFRPVTDTKSSVSFTEGAPLDSEQHDNRRKLPAKVQA